jgi:hypothetical protein
MGWDEICLKNSSQKYEAQRSLDLRLDERIILKWILQYVGCIRFSCLKIVTSECGNEPLVSSTSELLE